jgi:hypothetical protein
MGAGDDITNDVAKYFTDLIYNLVNLRKMDEITLEQMKKAILYSGNKELYDIFCNIS